MGAHKANLGSLILRETNVLADPGQHGHVLGYYPVKAASGTIAAGQVLALDASGQAVPLAALTAALGAGDGAKKAFTGALGRCRPGAVSVSAGGAESFTDDGFGALASAAGGTGHVNYATGKIAVTFNAAPAAAAQVVATYTPAPFGVATREADTASEAGVEICVHGPVRLAALLVAGAAPDAATVAELNALGVWVR